MNNKKKVLLVDDDARNVFALSAVLQSESFRCVSVMSAGEALDVLVQDPEIGVVLMDMMMPDMDGYQAIAAIRSNAGIAGIPIVAVTAQAMVGDREKCLSAGANDYLSKPVNTDTLLELLSVYVK